MSVQVFLQGQIVGSDDFLLSASQDFEDRAHWAALLSEVIPRALLSELGLSRMLLGSSGADQFLLLIPEEVREKAAAFCTGVSQALHAKTAGSVRLLWASTENLGDWSDVRKRLSDELRQRLLAPAGELAFNGFTPFDALAAAPDFGNLTQVIRDKGSVGWSPEQSADIVAEGKFNWDLLSAEGISYARHTALHAPDKPPATLPTLGSRAIGRRRWAVLVGNVDSFAARLRKSTTVEEHIQMSHMYKQFLAGELQMVCSQPEFFQRITLLRSGGSDFALYGSWNSCIAVAREIQRLFQRFVAANLTESPGVEGKTISMAMAVAPNSQSPLAEVWAEAMESLRLAKTSGKDGVHLLGRTLEWKQLADASDTRTVMARMVREFGCSPRFLHELADFYRDSGATATMPGARRQSDRLDRPWRFHSLLNTLIGTSRNREFERLKTELIADFTGRRASQIRLRPQGRVALEWAKLETEG